MDPVAAKINGSSQYQTVKQRQQKDGKEAVVTATGVTATASYVGKSSMKKAVLSEKNVKTTIDGIKTTTRTINNNVGLIERLARKFHIDYKTFNLDLTKRLAKLKDVKYIAPIVKSPIAKGAVASVSGALAFFVLVTGLKDAANNSAVAINDLKHKYDDVFAA